MLGLIRGQALLEVLRYVGSHDMVLYLKAPFNDTYPLHEQSVVGHEFTKKLYSLNKCTENSQK